MINLALKPGHISAIIIASITLVGVIIIIIKFHRRNKDKK